MVSLVFCITWTLSSTQYLQHPSLQQGSKALYSKLANLYSYKEQYKFDICNATDNTSLERYRRQIFTTCSKNIDIEKENFTIVMLTYRRESILPKIIKHYCSTLRLAKLVVIWNDVERSIPIAITNLTESCRVPLVFIKETENKITNRFKPRDHIETDCESCDCWLGRCSDYNILFTNRLQ